MAVLRIVSCGVHRPAGRSFISQWIGGAPGLSTRRSVATSAQRLDSYKLVVVGGGAGGSAVASKYAKKFGAGNVAVVEPSEKHFYQPMWTLVGAGLKTLQQSTGSTQSILPKECTWIKDSVTSFDPDNSKVATAGGKEISYEYLVVALGIQLRYDKISGAIEALENDPSVCSNYSSKYVTKTFPALQSFQEGNAIFSFPQGPIKCAGAPQKIMYLAEEIFRKAGKRDKANIKYNTALPVIFGVPKYANALNEVAKTRNIEVNFTQNLVEVKHSTKEAVFKRLNTEADEYETYKYSMLHISPSCWPYEALSSSSLADATGFLDVNRETLQHVKYSNVFGIGDCTNTPTAKTAAAVAGQAGIITTTINAALEGKASPAKYNGYTSCPLVTGKGRCIMAEFGYDGAILETFPFNQAKERRLMYHLKADFMPQLYWHALLKGRWNGPGIVRKALRLGMTSN